MAKEKRLIDANALEKEIENTRIRHAPDKGKMFKLIADAPAVDAVVLPCKVGDTVWFTTYGDIPTCTEVYRVSCNIGTDGVHSYFETQDTNGNTDYFHGEAFGKTVFLTAEEAEAALAKMDGDAE